MSYFRILVGFVTKMELEPLFTGTKWDMLKLLSARKASPLELSKELHTSIANVSQQLRLIEMAGLVKTEKTSASEKGKPRVLYSLAQDSAYIILVADRLSGKALVQLTEPRIAMLRIWIMPEQALHSPAEQLIRLIEPLMAVIQAIYIDSVAREFIVVTAKDEKKRLESACARFQGLLKLKTLSTEEAKGRDQLLSNMHPILMRDHEARTK